MQKRSLFEVNVEAVSKAMLFLANQTVLIDSKRELGLLNSAFVPAREGSVSDFLGKSES